MRLIFINRFYWPEMPATGQLLTDLAEALAERGHDVTVITSAATTASPPAETRHGVRIVRLQGTRWARRGIAGKAIDFATFYVRALWRSTRLATRDSILVPMTDPPLLGIGIWLAARVRGARIVHWVQDIYPEVATAVARTRWLDLLRPLRNVAWRRAECCVTLGHEMAAVLRAAGVDDRRVAVIPNWAPAGVVPHPRTADGSLRAKWRLGGKFIVAYSGNLGRVHDLQPVLAAADALRDANGISFVFVGDGAQRAALESEASARGLANVSFQPPQPRELLSESLAAADLHLITLRPECKSFVFPSKFHGIAAAGRPVLFLGPTDCELARLIAEHDLGACVANGDVDRAVGFIRELAGDATAWERHAAAARRFAGRHDVSKAAAQWEARFGAVNACAPGRRTGNCSPAR